MSLCLPGFFAHAGKEHSQEGVHTWSNTVKLGCSHLQDGGKKEPVRDMLLSGVLEQYYPVTDTILKQSMKAANKNCTNPEHSQFIKNVLKKLSSRS